MFTSRAEYRLILRQDNADMRLSELGHQIGLLSTSNYNRFVRKKAAVEQELIRLKNTYAGTVSLAKLLARPEIKYRDLPDANHSLGEEVIQQVEIAIKYAGYVERQAVEVEKLKTLEEKEIPHNFDYENVMSLRTEARQKLSRIQPRTIGQASRISGVSPSDISILLVWLKRGAQSQSQNDPGDVCDCN
jgi:tRNA uridine 5-carboxymethylaminomethyl modification enzyme